MKPTFEEKLQALKESIENWEEVAKDLKDRSCPLCYLVVKYGGQGRGQCMVGCPIYEKTGELQCHKTPFYDFCHDRTKENALAEVAFLKNLYIEMLESPDKSAKGGRSPKKSINICEDCGHWIGKPRGCNYEDDCPHKEKEKKEEWVDVTEEIECKLEDSGHGYGMCVYIYHEEDKPYYVKPREGIKETFNFHYYNLHKKYQIKVEGQYFRILKKQ